MICGEKLGGRLEEVRPLQQVLKVKIDGALRGVSPKG